MNCHLLRDQVIEFARGGLPYAVDRDRVVAHASHCPSCSLLMEQQRGLTAAFEEFAVESETAPPAALESILLSKFEAGRPAHGGHLKIAAAIAAIAAALVWLAARPRAAVAPPPSPVQALAAKPAAAPIPELPVIERVSKPIRRHATKPKDDGAPFVAIPYTVPLDPRERAVVMRMDMPVTALAAVGLAVAAPDPRASARTDVIIGEDGRIRAIRLLSISNSNFDRSVNP